MNIENMLAKPDKTIKEHSNELIEQANLLYKLGYIKSDDLFSDLLVACKNHDMGKANSMFQKRIKYGRKFNPDNEVPHSVLSIFFVDKNECKDPVSVYFAILYHHYNVESPGDVFYNKQDLIKIFLNELGFEDCAYNKMKRNNKKVTDLFQEKLCITQKQYTIMLKGLLHKCDYSASAGIDCEKKNDFLAECMDNWKNSLNIQYKPLQKYCMENSESNLIITAPTGMGKTEASLLWCGDNKCFYVLPLKTAINAMYDRIKLLCNENYKERVALVHSDMKSCYLQNSDKAGSEKFDFGYVQYSRQFSLPITICTPDQIFDFVLQYPGYEYKLAVLSYSKIIIDEIQMYSADLLAAIIFAVKMIHTLGGKVAVFTATLPPFVRNELIKILGDDVKIADYSEQGTLRHNVKVSEKALCSDDVAKIFHRTHSEKVKKYLVVCNSIDIADKLYDELKNSDIDANINIFHSNFIRKDRAKREKAILNASQKSNSDMDKPEIWISTSVVEASLDIDFDILITELLDLFSLFQRFGRVNRKGKKDFHSYNCYVFTEIQGNAHHFADETIHSFSKQAILTIDGVLSEKKKNALIDEYLSVEKIENSDYYGKYCKAFLGYENKLEYFDNANTELRRIDRTDVVPISVYSENEDVINEALNVLSSHNYGAEDKLRANETILSLTVPVSKYRLNNCKTAKSIYMNYTEIPVVDCEYSSEIGIYYFKEKAKPKNYSGANENFL